MAKKKEETTEELKEALLAKRRKAAPVNQEDLLSTGSTLLNLACAGRWKGGFIKGKYYYMVGDSASGKTWLAFTCFGEAAQNPHFNDYRLIYDNAEDGALFDVGAYFGEGVANRLEAPAKEDGEPKFSGTIEEFYFHLDDAIKAGKPFIYVLDSMDAISTEVDDEKFEKTKKAHQKDREESGSYGTAKAKANSNNIRRVVRQLRDTGSILIIVGQARDKIGTFGYGDKRSFSGGRALRFYATLQVLFSTKEKIKKTIKGKNRQLGIISKVEIKKNRITGKEPVIELPILHGYGVDDVGSCIDYLVEEGHWKKGPKGINAGELNLVASREDLISLIEQENKEVELKGLVSKVWAEIEHACTPKRKPRYE